MDLKHMEYFVTSADQGSFTKAARALSVTQPHVSRMVQAMETELDVELFDRDAQGVVLSEAGKAVYGHACDILRDVELLRRTHMESGDRVLCISAVTDSRMAVVFSHYCETRQGKKIRYQYLEAGVEQIMGQVHRHISEIGFVYVPQWRKMAFLRQLEHKKLEFVRLKQGQLCLRVGRRNRLYGLKGVELSALGTMRLVQAGNDYYSLLAWPCPASGEQTSLADIRAAVCTNTDAAVVNILGHTDMGNISCTVFPDSMCQGGLHTVQLYGREDPVYFGYVKRKNGRLSQEAAAFIQYLKEELADGMEEGGNKGREKQ